MRFVSLTVLAVCFAVTPLLAQPTACVIETLAGGQDTPVGDGGLAVDADLVAADIAHGPDGSLYIADFGHWSIRRVGLDGVIERVAGSGVGGEYSPDGTPALEASIQPRYLAVDAFGDLLFTDRGRVRKVTSEGTIVTVAGNGSDEFSGDGGPAAEAGIGDSPSIAAEADGSLLIADSGHYRIRRVTPDGVIQTIAGSGSASASGDGGPALDAEIGSPRTLTVDSDGSIYFWGSVSGSNRPGIRRIRPDGVIEQHSPYFRSVSDLAIDVDGNLFAVASDIYRYDGAEWIEIADVSAAALSVAPTGEVLALIYFDNQVVRVDDGSLDVAAGVGRAALHGDGGLASKAHVSYATGISVASDGSIYFADAGVDRIRRIAPNGIVHRFGGSTPDGLLEPGGLATETYIPNPERITVGSDGVVYVSGSSLVPNQPIAAIGLDGIVSSVPFNTGPRRVEDIEADDKGNLIITYEGSSTARFLQVIGDDPSGGFIHDDANGELAIGPDGLVFLGGRNSEWRTISLAGRSAWGVPSLGSDLSSVPGLTGYSSLSPRAVAAGPDGSLYWAGGSTIWRMLPNQAIELIAGGEEEGYSDETGPADQALFSGIEEMTFGPDGHLYLADTDRVRRITSPHECPSAGIRPKIASFGIVNGASYRALAPGSVFAIFGTGLGPEEFAGAVLGQDGKLPTELGGTRVLFDGVPAPMIFSSEGQVNGIVPFFVPITHKRVEGGSEFIPGNGVDIVVEYEGAASDPSGHGFNEVWPGIFTLDASGKGPGAFLDANSVLIGPDNPATPGSIVVMWATGAGLMDPAQEDGSITNGPTLPKPVLPVTADIGGLPAVVEYAGAAPGLAAGIIQVNVRIPEGLTQTGDVPVRLFVGVPFTPGGPMHPTVYVEAN